MIAAVPDRSGRVDDELGGQFESGRDAGFAGFATVEFTAGFQQFRPAARWIAPSTPPPPRSEQLAALTMASTSSLVMSAVIISIILHSCFSDSIEKNNALLMQNQVLMRNNSAKNAEQCQIVLMLYEYCSETKVFLPENCRMISGLKSNAHP